MTRNVLASYGLAALMTAFIACAQGGDGDAPNDDAGGGDDASLHTTSSSGGSTGGTNAAGGAGGKAPQGGTDEGGKDPATTTSTGAGAGGSSTTSGSSSVSSGSGGGAPVGWTCNASYFAAADGCDCGCGVLDPDCADASAASCTYCQNAGSCGLGTCPGNINVVDNATCDAVSCGDGILGPGEQCDDGNTMSGDGCDAQCLLELPAAWLCSASYYGGADGCDCGCGAVDPDCADNTAASCDYCDDLGSCGIGTCPANIDPIDNAICI